MSSTRGAVDDRYRVFAKYRRRKRVVGCPCCTSPDDERRLVARPLRELSADDLVGYVQSELCTWGNERDFKHFLPRICELLVAPLLQPESDSLGIWPQSVFSRLTYAQWQTWPEDEREAVLSFVRTTWRGALQLPRSTIGMDDWLESAGTLEGTATEYMDDFEFASRCPAASHLATFIETRAGEIAGGTLRWTWWESADDSIVSWLRGPKPRATAGESSASSMEKKPTKTGPRSSPRLATPTIMRAPEQQTAAIVSRAVFSSHPPIRWRNPSNRQKRFDRDGPLVGAFIGGSPGWPQVPPGPA